MLGHLINGIATGGGYALLAVGLTFTLGISRVFNFAYGSFYTVAAFTVSWLMGIGIVGGYPIAALIGIAMIVVIGIIFAAVAVLPVLKISQDAVMVATLAAGIAMTSAAQGIFGTQLQVIPSPLEEPTFIVDNTSFSPQTMLIVITGPIVALALSLFLKKTILGTRMRAVAISPTLAAATGVRTTGIAAASVVLGVVLAGLSAILTAPEKVIDISTGDAVLLSAFTAAALAGMGNLWGAVYVAFGLGIAESLFSSYVSSAYSEALIFGVLILTLIFRPKGLFGGH